MMNIAIVNKATTPIGVDLGAMVRACQLQVNRDFAPIWNVGANLIMLDNFTDQYAALILVDDPDQASALGYHELSPNGHPIGKVFVKTTLQARELVSTVFSHELLEMVLNPSVDKLAKNPRNGYTYALEDCDQVQAENYPIDGVPVSNFVFPSWFNPAATSAEKFDFLGSVKAPFVLARGGYANVQVNGRWTQIFADQMAFERYHSKEHDRSPQILAAKKPFASMKLFNPKQYTVVKAY